MIFIRIIELVKENNQFKTAELKKLRKYKLKTQNQIFFLGCCNQTSAIGFFESWRSIISIPQEGVFRALTSSHAPVSDKCIS